MKKTKNSLLSQFLIHSKSNFENSRFEQSWSVPASNLLDDSEGGCSSDTREPSNVSESLNTFKTDAVGSKNSSRKETGECMNACNGNKKTESLNLIKESKNGSKETFVHSANHSEKSAQKHAQNLKFRSNSSRTTPFHSKSSRSGPSLSKFSPWF